MASSAMRVASGALAASSASWSPLPSRKSSNENSRSSPASRRDGKAGRAGSSCSVSVWSRSSRPWPAKAWLRPRPRFTWPPPGSSGA
eukprot:2699187-Pyramimonas_sp.AAC.1